MPAAKKKTAKKKSAKKKQPSVAQLAEKALNGKGRRPIYAPRGNKLHCKS